MTSSRVLAIFARFPEPGKVKTRLAARVGSQEACRIFEEILRGQIREHRNRAYDLVVYVTPEARVGEFALRYEVPAKPQRGSDLGARMGASFQELLTRYDAVAIVGSDIPTLSMGRVEEAFRRLSDVDVVLGPSPDGGYYLIASRFSPNAFEGISWSTPRVLGQTLELLRQQGKTWFLLPEEKDVDE